jgi:hypothetical protein
LVLLEDCSIETAAGRQRKVDYQTKRNRATILLSLRNRASHGIAGKPLFMVSACRGNPGKPADLRRRNTLAAANISNASVAGSGTAANTPASNPLPAVWPKWERQVV